RLDSIVAYVAAGYVDSIPPEELHGIARKAVSQYADSATSAEDLYRTAAKAVLASLHDPHTRLVFHERADAKEGTIGAALVMHGHWGIVGGPPLANLPAALADI